MAVVQDLRQQIAAGKLRPGDRVLSERQLAQRYRQSLHVVRLALRNLRDDGVVVRKRAVLQRRDGWLCVVATATAAA